MPTYEYKCDACGHAFERFQSITSGPVRKCPECGKNKVKRLISTGAGFVFKGSGFYITDYRDESYKTAAKSESGSSSDGGNESGGSSSEGKSDAKPDAKPAASSGTETKSSGSETKPSGSASAESKPAATKPDKGASKKK